MWGRGRELDLLTERCRHVRVERRSVVVFGRIGLIFYTFHPSFHPPLEHGPSVLMNLSLPLTLPDYVREGNHDRQRRSRANRAQLSREQLPNDVVQGVITASTPPYYIL